METTQNRGNQVLENNGWGRVTRKDKEDRPIKGENQERGGNKKESKGIYLVGGGRKVALHDGRKVKKEWKRRDTSSETQQPTSITSTLCAEYGMA